MTFNDQNHSVDTASNIAMDKIQSFDTWRYCADRLKIINKNTLESDKQQRFAYEMAKMIPID